jgi:molybdopterin molybdotransferase
MPEFLKLKSVNEARAVFYQALGEVHPGAEWIPSLSALGRVTAESVVAQEYLPAFSRSAMDGYAVQAADTFGASESLPLRLKIVGELPMGAEPALVLHPGEAALIHTGGMLAQGVDAVVALENCRALSSLVLEVFTPVTSGENVIFKGEDVKPGKVVIPAGKRIRSAEVGGLFSLGVTQVSVVQKPLFGILSSGDEVVPPTAIPSIGQVRDINSESLAAVVEAAGGRYQFYPIVPDDREQLRQSIRLAYQQSDAVLITAGSSVSSRDITAELIHELGQPGVLVHGINIRPGKPTILAVCNGKPVIGMPGNPMSALVIAELFLKPLVAWMLGEINPAPRPMLQARLTVNLSSQVGKEEWLPVRLVPQGAEWLAEPIFFKSNLIFQLADAAGLLHIEPDAAGKMAGEMVDVLIF